MQAFTKSLFFHDWQITASMVITGLWVRQAKKSEKQGIQSMPKLESYNISTRSYD